jgi:predicted deacylase
MLIFAQASVGLANGTLVLQAGTRWETTGCIVDSGVPGPVALILGGVHGNEPAGAVAAESVCAFRPVRGKLVIVPRVNAPGLQQSLRYLPESGDMNRAYPPAGNETPADRMGAEIIGLMNQYQITMLIDLHEARTFHKIDRTSLGQTLLFADNAASTGLAMDTVDAVNLHIADNVAKFSLVGHPIRASSAWYAGKFLGIAAFTVETSSRQPLAERARQHLLVVTELLTAGGWLAR